MQNYNPRGTDATALPWVVPSAEVSADVAFAPAGTTGVDVSVQVTGVIVLLVVLGVVLLASKWPSLG